MSKAAGSSWSWCWCWCLVVRTRSFWIEGAPQNGWHRVDVLGGGLESFEDSWYSKYQHPGLVNDSRVAPHHLIDLKLNFCWIPAATQEIITQQSTELGGNTGNPQNPKDLRVRTPLRRVQGRVWAGPSNRWLLNTPNHL